MDFDGTQAWIYFKEKQDSSAQTGIETFVTQHPDQQDYVMVPVGVHDIQVHKAGTLSFSNERGYDVCVGDEVEVARGKWFRSKGMVQIVYFDKASLFIVCDTDGQKVSNIGICFTDLKICLDQRSDYLLPRAHGAFRRATLAMGRP